MVLSEAGITCAFIPATFEAKERKTTVYAQLAELHRIPAKLAGAAINR
jgi:hypothetical protein